MTQQAQVRNPFMLLLNPEVVLAAIHGSERLEKLNRHLCRPLDGPAGIGVQGAADQIIADSPDGPDEPLATSTCD